MATFSNYIPFFFLTTLLLSQQINARDSQFFSKTPRFNNNNVKETELPNNNEGPVNKPEQEPVFIPETENGYGLYGHESGQLPPSTTTTTTTNAAPYTTATSYEPYKTESEEDASKYNNNKKYYHYNKDAYDTNQNDMRNTRLTDTSYNNNNNYYNKDAFGGNQYEFGNSKYTEGEFNSMANQNNQKYYYNDNNNAANDRYYHYNNNNNAAKERYYYNNKAASNRFNGEKQGMSDTRFLEGGKYFYDVNTEKYNPTLYGESSKEVNHRAWYNNRGYFGNNNANSYENNNSMEGYQNQEEFEDDQDDFEP